ncbi:transcription factor HES-7.1-B-like [Ranitomeya variabilis]|uniref:transcription factor HES-7.1-B-like n=1 Tax=Ranitomeya variabilis TaxID=490064 RepID=UPI0040560783
MRGEKKSPPGTRRKLLKPMVERRRRERINSCLEKLRLLLADAMKNEKKLKNPKMEKAEILEYTVEFLQSRMTSVKSSREVLQSIDFRSGFHKCLETTVNFITQNQQLSPSSKELFFKQLSSGVHLYSHCLRRPLHPTSPETSKWLNHHSYTFAVNNVDNQSDCHSDQMCRSWRPWL